VTCRKNSAATVGDPRELVSRDIHVYADLFPKAGDLSSRSSSFSPFYSGRQSNSLGQLQSVAH
jgi:hypothetical protein